ncbi:UDP-2-acetamido-2-deoxy-3-oxo-D-glucuronate aminotransferase [subsurface metagenome]
MKEIRMVDLKGQYKKIQTLINNSIENVINSTAFINGPEVKSFQNNLEKYLDVKHVIPCGNGTDALQISLMSLDLKPGDEIITPDFTFIATAEVIAFLGLKPVFVDVEPDSFNISPDSIKRSLSTKTKAIVPVHLFGQCANMNEINNIAKENNLFVIEDAAQALGAECLYGNGSKSKAGTIGDIGTTSFFPSKNLGAYGDGGAIITNNENLAKKIRLIGNHGMEKKYYHDSIGVNSRLDSIQAAILNVKLKYLDEYNRSRQKAAAFYDEAFQNLENITIPYRDKFSTHIFHQYTILTDPELRDPLKNHLAQNAIPSMIYYPVPLHRQKAFGSYGFDNKNFPVTGSLCQRVLSLPMHTELEIEQLDYIVNHVINFFNNHK